MAKEKGTEIGDLLKSQQGADLDNVLYLRLLPDEKRRFKKLAEESGVTVTAMARALVSATLNAGPSALIEFLKNARTSGKARAPLKKAMDGIPSRTKIKPASYFRDRGVKLDDAK